MSLIILLQYTIEHITLYWSFCLCSNLHYNVSYIPDIKKFNTILVNQLISPILLYSLNIIQENDQDVNVLYIPIYFCFYSLCHCIYFYFAHRLLHHRLLYKYIHYIHHENKNPTSYDAFYSHWLEHIFANLMSITIGPYLVPSNNDIFRIWIHLCTLNTLHSHNSTIRLYHPLAHDIHHLLFRYNYGTGDFMDKLFGTYYKFVQ